MNFLGKVLAIIIIGWLLLQVVPFVVLILTVM